MAGTLETFVLSDPAASGRRRRAGQLRDLRPELTVTVFDIVPAERLALAYDEAMAYRYHGSVMSQAERSCAAGHLAILQTFLERGRADYALILEDDVDLDPGFPLLAMAELMSATSIDYLKLFTRFRTPSRYFCSYRGLSLYRATWPPLGMQAFLVSRAGARRLYNHALQLRHLIRPIDELFDRFWDTGVPVMVLHPSPALEMMQPTLIHGADNRRYIDERNAQLRGGQRLERAWSTRLAEKVQRLRSRKAMAAFDRDLERRLTTSRDSVYYHLFGHSS